MVGNETPGDKTPPTDPARKPLAKVFHCTNCGASVELRFPGASISIICQGCHSVIDAQDPNKRILTKYFKATGKYTPLIPLGTRGKFKDHTWELIGFMVRSDVASYYSWQEYLLFNPYYGYRWLTEDQGHWNFVTTIKNKPEQQGSAIVTYNRDSYRIFNSGSAKVDYVIGEFYWRVVIESQVTMKDYLCPPRMLSKEMDGADMVWSQSEYITSEEVRKAFGLQDRLPQPVGVSPTAPDTANRAAKKIAYFGFIFWVLLTCFQFYFCSTATSDLVLDYKNTFIPNEKKADLTTPVFTLKKDMSNVRIGFSAPCNNSWFWLSGELVNNDTGVSYPFEQECSYYYGTDSDGAWSEGNSSPKAIVPSVPGGRYYINVDTESGDFKTKDPLEFSIDVTRNVATFGNYFLTTFLLAIMPFLAWCLSRQTEMARWSNSDYNPYIQTAKTYGGYGD